GDISRKGGGEFEGHTSHKNGRDADVRPLRRDNRLDPVSVGEIAYDSIRTEELVKLILNRHPKATIFFNDQRLINKKLTQQAAGHHNHLHIRFP
nr:peptidoglycan-binding protein [Acidobacteriota bacterium]